MDYYGIIAPDAGANAAQFPNVTGCEAAVTSAVDGTTGRATVTYMCNYTSDDAVPSAGFTFTANSKTGTNTGGLRSCSFCCACMAC